MLLHSLPLVTEMESWREKDETKWSVGQSGSPSFSPGLWCTEGLERLEEGLRRGRDRAGGQVCVKELRRFHFLPVWDSFPPNWLWRLRVSEVSVRNKRGLCVLWGGGIFCAFSLNFFILLHLGNIFSKHKPAETAGFDLIILFSLNVCLS